MSGTPFKRQVLAKIRELGGWSKVFERIASGDTLVKISEDVNCSRSFLNHLICDNDARREIYQLARRESAGALAEIAAQIADNVRADKDEIKKAQLRIEQRRYLAGVYDREQFGEQPKSVAPVINIGQLHLDALRARALPTPPPVPALPPGPPVKEAEIVEETAV